MCGGAGEASGVKKAVGVRSGEGAGRRKRVAGRWGRGLVRWMPGKMNGEGADAGIQAAKEGIRQVGADWQGGWLVILHGDKVWMASPTKVVPATGPRPLPQTGLTW